MKKQKILKREDFKYEANLRYYSFKDLKLGIEIGIEPCFNGFDVAIYKIGDMGPLREKECTDQKDYGSSGFISREIRSSRPQIRTKETWEIALKIANKFYSSILNYLNIRKSGILEEEEGTESRVFQEIKTKMPIHGINPKGRI